MAGGRNALDNEIDQLRVAADAVHGVDAVDVGEGLANHRAVRLRWILFHAHMDLRVPHVQRAVDQIQKRLSRRRRPSHGDGFSCHKKNKKKILL